jgi:Protein of unknown function (DUF2878)
VLLILNFVLCQVGWFASVLGGANHLPWVGPVVVMAVVAWHLHTAIRPAEEALLVGVCGLVGAVFDSGLVAAGWLGYPSGLLSSVLAPYWIVTMWMLFATTLNVSLRWLRKRYWVSAATGLVAGPLSYIAGAELGGVEFLNREAALLALALGWAVMLPALTAVAARLDGVTARTVPLAEAVR